MNRVETYEYPKEVIREALLNAIAHKDYSGEVPIQISVYKDKIMIWNEGQLSENWTIETLLDKHSLKLFNPDIANALFRRGYISSDISVEFRKDIYNERHLQSLPLNERQVKAVLYVKEKGKITNKEYQEINNTTDMTALRDLETLIQLNIIKRIGEKKDVYYELAS